MKTALNWILGTIVVLVFTITALPATIVFLVDTIYPDFCDEVVFYLGPKIPMAVIFLSQAVWMWFVTIPVCF